MATALSMFFRTVGVVVTATSVCVLGAGCAAFRASQPQLQPGQAPATRNNFVTELLTAVPQLTIARAGTNALLSWPGTAIPFDLQSKLNVAATNWTMVNGSFPATNGLVYAVVPLTTNPKFFRLQQR